MEINFPTITFWGDGVTVFLRVEVAPEYRPPPIRSRIHAEI